MSLQVTTRQHSPEMAVVRIGGVGEERLLLALVDGIEVLANSVPCVLIDVDELVLHSSKAVRSFVGQLLDRVDEGSVAFTARRGTARQILRRWGGAGVVIVASADDARAQWKTRVARWAAAASAPREKGSHVPRRPCHE